MSKNIFCVCCKYWHSISILRPRVFTSSHSQLLKVLSFEQLGEVEVLGVVAEVLEQRLEGGSVLGPVCPALQHHPVVVIVRLLGHGEPVARLQVLQGLDTRLALVWLQQKYF